MLADQELIINTDEKGVTIEKDLDNFFSLVGINFSSIVNNDKKIVEKINELSSQGWELYQVTTGVQSSSATAQGIFITRYLFRKQKKIDNFYFLSLKIKLFIVKIR